MENVIAGRLQSLRCGQVQRYRNIAILPLLAPDGAFQYRTLGVGLDTSEIILTEVSTDGAVPELLVVNRSKTPVLLIDGEEFAGAKQNRVFNTFILLKELSRPRIPVICTEPGRWSYASAAFAESGNVGCGFDNRDRGEALADAAIVHADEVIHSDLFQLETAGHTDAVSMVSFRNRGRHYRE